MSTTSTEDIMEFLDWSSPWDREDIDAWLAKRDAEVAVKALRDAAEAVAVEMDWGHLEGAENWLLERAKRIEALDAWRAIAPALDALTEAKAIEIRETRTAKPNTTEEET